MLDHRHLQAFVFQNSAGGIYLLDLESLRFVYVNEVAAAQSDCTADELLEKSISDLMVDFHEGLFQKEVRPLVTGEKEKVIIEGRFRRSGGWEYPAELHLQMFESSPAPLCMVQVFDITEQRRTEKERDNLIEALSQKNRELKQFSFITTHNLRAPVANLRSLMYLIDEQTVEDREIREILSDIRHTVRFLDVTIHDLIRILIIKDNPVRLEELNFSDLFQNVLQQVRYLIKVHKPQIRTDFTEAPSIEFNRIYLESIFLNLLTNSMKFRSPSRRLEISAETRNEGPRVRLTFRDNGVGLDLERYRKKLFGLYQRFHSHSGSKGIGLYLIKTQVESLGGTIDIQSEVGEGMTVEICFLKNPEDDQWNTDPGQRILC